MPAPRKPDDISREEDFRDYDDRNIDEGWPYDDAAGAGARPVGNAAYGEPAANFESDRNEGYQVEGIEADGQQERLVDSDTPATIGVEESDDLEERITDAIESLDIAMMDAIDVHVDDGEVTLEGLVDEASAVRIIAAKVKSISGVKSVVNNLRAGGVDGRMPDED
ncbi:BON domain-containing protein [Neorhizobium sp. AL 9.2.2]|jgi:hypothetical protein|uniref:BON domain-containing protein n=1 Tax=Neorhizobium sp. AL 9.2.2 TaxID=2712894 RepID=UPI001571E1B2|nr:BON domain-containing protein [Neorhizobium sp. AL 9.2.2]NSY18128.1 BON domain-containing protein [Neorhizobium sp. AL 9.2.2]